MSEVVGIRPDVTVDKNDIRRGLETTAMEALDRANSVGRMLGMVIVVFAVSDEGVLTTVRRAHSAGDGAPSPSFLEAKAGATLLASSTTGAV